jgi:hypothetical protein
LTALARSLTGERVPLPRYPVPLTDASAVVAWLAEAGWDAARIATVRQARKAAGERWPLLSEPVEYPGVGAAQFAAARAAVVARIAPAKTRVRDTSVPLDPASARLLAEVPPHHGPAG